MLDGARGKKQVWRPNIWTWGLSALQSKKTTINFGLDHRKT